MDMITEQQQIETLKKWWKTYGNTLIVSVALAILIVLAWQWWHQHREQELNFASARYEQLLTSVVNNDEQGVLTQAQRIMERYTDTPYAPLAALFLARQEINQQKYQNASAHLQWVMAHSSDKALKQIARLRAARLALQLHAPDQALTLLKTIDDPSFQVAIFEITGDCLKVKGDVQGAHQAYLQALQGFPGIENNRPILQMKADDLATGDAA